MPSSATAILAFHPLSPWEKTREKDSAMLTQKNQKAFYDFYRAAGDNPALDDRSRALVSLATAMALGCYP